MDRQERDLRDLVFGDALGATSEAELQAISSHPASRDELNRLLRLREVLLSVGEEEPPRRTVLVAPTQVGAGHPAAAAWWQRWFGAPGWAFAGASALAMAIVFHAVWTTPQPAPSTPMVAQAPSPALPATPAAAQPASDSEARVLALVDARVAEAVQQVRAEMASRQQQDTLRLVAATEDRLRSQHDQEMLEMREAVYFMKKQFGRQLVANVALASEAQ